MDKGISNKWTRGARQQAFPGEARVAAIRSPLRGISPRARSGELTVSFAGPAPQGSLSGGRGFGGAWGLLDSWSGSPEDRIEYE